LMGRSPPTHAGVRLAAYAGVMTDVLTRSPTSWPSSIRFQLTIQS
jgi:hypothetical protein